MNSALAKLQYLSNKSEFEFVFAGDNGNPPYQDSNRLRFCNLVASKPKSQSTLLAYGSLSSPQKPISLLSLSSMHHHANRPRRPLCKEHFLTHLERQRLLILEPLYSTSSHTTPLSFAAAHPLSSHFNSHTPSFSEEPSHPSHPSSKNSELLQSKQRKTNSVTTKIR